MNPLAWLKLIPVVVEGASLAVAAFKGKDDGYRTQERIDRMRARGAANRALRAKYKPEDDVPTKREKPPKE